MPGIEWTDFSGGMISDINEIVAPLNTFKNMQNADCWSEAGVVKGLTDFVILDSFPANKNYDHHVVFPAHGVKDYAIVMMHDGTIYSYDPTDAGSEFVSIGSVTAGARMAYANDRVYVFYRNMTAPTTGNTVRKVIEFDYVAETFSISDILIQEYFTVGDTTEIAHANAGLDYFARMIYTDLRNDNSESKGIIVYAQDNNESQFAVKITKSAGFYGLKCYGSIKGLTSDIFLTPGYLFTIKDEPSYIPITDVLAFGGGFGFSASNEIWVTKTDSGGTNNQTFLTFILDEWDSGNEYIAADHKIKVFGVEYNINSITKDTTTSPPGVYYILALDANVPELTMYPTEVLTAASGQYVELDVQLDFVSNVIYLPVMRRFREIVGVQVDENRPESNFTSGTGNFLAPLGNYLFTANPYFPDLFGVGEDLDKKGWLSWSWITGEGLYAFGLLPDVNLITSPGFSSEIIDMFAFKENLLVFHQGGLVRFVLESGVPFPFDSDQHGVDASFNYYVDKFRLFLYSNKQIKMAVFSRKNIEKGEFDFVELSRGIASLVSNASTNARFGYQPDAKLLHFTDTTDNVDNFICSLRNQKPAWVKWVNAAGNTGVEATMYNSFVLNGKVYFVGTDNSVYRIYEETSTYLQSLTVETHNTFIPLGNDYIRKVELVYQQASGSFVFDVYLDDVKVYTETITTVKSVPGFYEIRFPRTAVTRFSKLRWVLTKASVGADSFKLMGVFVNRDSYGRETQKGY
jgi:hypothetical protein